MTVREARGGDLRELLELYLHLHEEKVPALDPRVLRVWSDILKDENHHVIVCEEEGRIVSSCVCVLVPNLTRNARPYAVIENVVTDPAFRRRGCGSACLHRAKEIAEEHNCYKIMLLTGSKEESTHRFYRKAGYDGTEKTGYIQRLK